MPSLEIHPLSELRDEAAGLLAERYARQRAAEQLLPEIEDFAAHLPEEDGLVASEWDAEEPGPAKRRYELTESGHELLRAWAKALGQMQNVVTAFIKRYGKEVK